jgi:hypothetical protein
LTRGSRSQPWNRIFSWGTGGQGPCQCIDALKLGTAPMSTQPELELATLKDLETSQLPMILPVLLKHQIILIYLRYEGSRGEAMIRCLVYAKLGTENYSGTHECQPALPRQHRRSPFVAQYPFCVWFNIAFQDALFKVSPCERCAWKGIIQRDPTGS